MLHPLKSGTYTITSGFGLRWGVLHRGVDYAASLGTPIYAAEGGTVVDARSGVSGFGCWIVIDHVINGKKVSTVYGHMFPSGLLVSKGQKVVAGQKIALVGNNGDTTGPHCHFEVWVGGRLTGGTAVDPTPWTTGSVVTPTTTLPTLREGSTGTIVTKLQTFMTRTFPSYNDYTPTGYFGTLTEAGIREFQSRTGLTPDGVVGSSTWAMLKRYGFAI